MNPIPTPSRASASNGLEALVLEQRMRWAAIGEDHDRATSAADRSGTRPSSWTSTTRSGTPSRQWARSRDAGAELVVARRVRWPAGDDDEPTHAGLAGPSRLRRECPVQERQTLDRQPVLRHGEPTPDRGRAGDRGVVDRERLDADRSRIVGGGEGPDEPCPIEPILARGAAIGPACLDMRDAMTGAFGSPPPGLAPRC